MSNNASLLLCCNCGLPLFKLSDSCDYCSWHRGSNDVQIIGKFDFQPQNCSFCPKKRVIFSLSRGRKLVCRAGDRQPLHLIKWCPDYWRHHLFEMFLKDIICYLRGGVECFIGFNDSGRSWKLINKFPHKKATGVSTPVMIILAYCCFFKNKNKNIFS